MMLKVNGGAVRAQNVQSRRQVWQGNFTERTFLFLLFHVQSVAPVGPSVISDLPMPTRGVYSARHMLALSNLPITADVTAMLTRMNIGRFNVFSHLRGSFGKFRRYRRDRPRQLALDGFLERLRPRARPPWRS